MTQKKAFSVNDFGLPVLVLLLLALPFIVFFCFWYGRADDEVFLDVLVAEAQQRGLEYSFVEYPPASTELPVDIARDMRSGLYPVLELRITRGEERQVRFFFNQATQSRLVPNTIAIAAIAPEDAMERSRWRTGTYFFGQATELCHELLSLTF